MRNGSFRAAFCFDCIVFWLQKPVLTQVLLRKKHLHSSIKIRLLGGSCGLFGLGHSSLAKAAVCQQRAKHRTAVLAISRLKAH